MTTNGQPKGPITQSQRKIIQNYSYLSEDLIGTGYSSQVFKGLQDHSGKPVAVKVVNLSRIREKGLQQMLNRQINFLQTLNHENVIRCTDVLMTANNCYIITQLCLEGDLGSFLKKKKHLTLEQGLPLILQICKGIINLHSKRIVHRDLKPQNILLQKQIPKIADFGFAIREGDFDKQKYSVGSPLYMSPQALINQDYTMKNDVWALGVIIYQILEGKAPWSPQNQAELKEAIKKSIRFRHIRNIQIQQCIFGCLAYDEKVRLTIPEVITQIEQILGIVKVRDQDKQNTRYGNENEQQIIEDNTEIYKAMRNNYNLLKWIVNYSRFAAKLLPKISHHLNCQEELKKSFMELTARVLHLTVSKLYRIDQVHDQLPLSYYQHFKKTSNFQKIKAVSSEYHQRYLLLLTRLPFKYYHPPSLALDLPSSIAYSLEQVQIEPQCSQQHLAVVSLLLILVQSNQLAHHHSPSTLSQMINFQELIQNASSPIQISDIERLKTKRSDILKRINQFQIISAEKGFISV